MFFSREILTIFLKIFHPILIKSAISILSNDYKYVPDAWSFLNVFTNLKRVYVFSYKIMEKKHSLTLVFFTGIFHRITIRFGNAYLYFYDVT